MTTPPFSEVYQQFQVDAPRIHFYINDVKETDIDVICAYLLQDEECGQAALHWCTQTALAPIYIAKWERVIKTYGECTHLVDDGPQTIRILDSKLVIKKPFKIMREAVDGSASLPAYSRTTTLTELSKIRLTLQIDHRGSVLKQRPRYKRLGR